MDLSMVIPVKEESENLPELMKEIVEAMAPTGFEYEVIVIDDGGGADRLHDDDGSDGELLGLR